VHLFSRRSYIDYPAPPVAGAPPAPPIDRGYPNVLELNYDLPDVVRWRNFLLGDRRVASVPLDSIQRAVAFKDFHVHLNTSLADVTAGNGKVGARAGSRRMRFDHLVAATGYRIDLAAQPELKRIHESIALWRDRFRPQAGEESEAGASHPYLGAGFEFLARAGADAPYLRNVHCFNLAGALSFGRRRAEQRVPRAARHGDRSRSQSRRRGRRRARALHQHTAHGARFGAISARRRDTGAERGLVGV
jgi:cation diffusion facilitator CzcD-associated flavoprotein CzcO